MTEWVTESVTEGATQGVTEGVTESVLYPVSGCIDLGPPLALRHEKEQGARLPTPLKAVWRPAKGGWRRAVAYLAITTLRVSP